jgi:hypothetical protein
MGYLVLQRINDNTSIIIDGQQRLTTVTLIIIAALYQLKELVENNDHPEDNQRRLEALQRSYIGALNPVSLTVENKLQLNRNNQSYFKTYLASLQKPRVSRIKRSEKQLADACRFFQDKFKAVKWSGDMIAGFIEAMASRLLFTTIRVGSEVNAYRVFETLNARGVQLSTPDLLKNFIFSAIDQNHSAHETLITEIEDQWSRVLDQLGKSDFSHFLLTSWCNDFGDEGIEDWAERLGNMTLMTGSANKDIDQQPFPTKKNWLAGSPYLISRKASEYQEWNKAAIESRQRWLADQACAIWRVSQFS